MKLIIAFLLALTAHGAVSWTGNLGTAATRAAASDSGVAVAIIDCTGAPGARVGSNPEAKTALDEAIRGDTLKFEANCVWTTFVGEEFQLHAKTGSGYVTITTTEDDKLPSPGTRITPAYIPLTPRFRIEDGNGPFFALYVAGAGDSVKRTPGVPASHYYFKGVTFEFASDFLAGDDTVTSGAVEVTGATRASGNTLSTWDITSLTVASNVATVTVSSSHNGLLTGDVVGFTGVVPTDLNGLKTITVSGGSTTQFTFAAPGVGDGDYLTTQVHYQYPPSPDYLPDDIIFDRIIATSIGWQNEGKVLSLAMKNATVRDSYLDGSQVRSSDQQTIASYNGSGPYLIRNNYVGGATENIMFGGSAQTIDTPNTGSIIEFNYLPHTPERHWGQRWDRLVGSGIGKNGLVFAGRITTASVANGTTGSWIATNTGYVDGCGASGCSGSVEPAWASCTTAATNCPFLDGTVQWRRFGTSSSDWLIKNNFEIKNAIDTILRYNVLEYMWNDATDNGQETGVNIKAETQTKFPAYNNNCVPTYAGTVDVAVDGVTVTVSTTTDGIFPYQINLVDDDGVDASVINILGVAYEISTFDSATQLTLVAPGTTTQRTNEASTYGESPSSPCYPEWNYNTQFTNNWMRNMSRPFKNTPGTNSRKDWSYGMIFRNNLMTDIDANYWTDRTGSSIVTDGKTFLYLDAGGLPGQFIENNTGVGAATLTTAIYAANQTRAVGDTVIRGNIFQGGDTYAFRGTGASHGTVLTSLSGLGGTPIPASRYDKNIFGGNNLTTNYSVSGTHVNLCSGGLNTSCIGTQQWVNLLTDYTNGKYSVWPGSGDRVASIYKQWGVNGDNPGANLHLIPRINGLTVTAGDTEVLFRYSVSPVIAEIACVIEVHTAPDFQSTTFEGVATGYAGELSDLATYYGQDSDQHDKWPGNSMSRMIVVGHTVPLAVSTRHFYRLSCGGDLRTGEFTTTAAVAGTATLRASSSSASSMTYGYAYSRATDEITGAATGSCAGNVCTATVNKGVVYSRFGTGPVRATLIQ